MKPKKTDDADVHKRSGLYRDIGFALSILLILAAFTWEKKERNNFTLENNILFEEEEEIADITKEKKPPPPPPPPPQIEVVEDDEVIEEEQPEFEEVDIEEFEEIEIPDVEAEEVAEEPIFTVVEDMPEFPGGQAAMFAFISKEVEYPELEKQNNIEGTAVVSFVIDAKGNVTDVKIFPGTESKATENMRKEAIRVINMMPKWKPGKQRGKPVKVRFTVPIRFKLRN